MSCKNEFFAKLYDPLYCLGLSAAYNGFFYLAYAVWLVTEAPGRLLLVKKRLYPEVVKRLAGKQ